MGQNGRRKRAGRPHEWSYSSGLVTDEKEVMNLDEEASLIGTAWRLQKGMRQKAMRQQW